MKKFLIPILIVLPALLLLTGCLNLSLGGGTHTAAQGPTLGQQLIDLQVARNSGAISQQEYEVLRARLLEKK